MTVWASRSFRALGLLVLPIVGLARPGDFDYYTRVRCYRAVSRRYPPDSLLLNLLPLSSTMAGPREALLHMIIAKNFGCTDFIVGHDHAAAMLLLHGAHGFGHGVIGGEHDRLPHGEALQGFPQKVGVEGQALTRL